MLLGCDVGGTFTDCILLDPDGGRLVTRKVPTTPRDPGEGAAAGLAALLAEAGVAPHEVTRVVHATTTATNALLTRRAVRVALVTNTGFEDVLEIARQDRPDLYVPTARRAPPLVARESRFGVAGRLDHRGHEVVPLDEDQVRALAPRLAHHDAVAVSLLHAYANPDHERRVAAVLRGALPGVRVTTSSDVAPEFREYERTSTTAANAFLLPVLEDYLARLEKRLHAAGLTAPLLVLTSSGGAALPATLAKVPVTAALSGPAGGAGALSVLARLTGEPNILGLDMGGTSTDLAAVVDGDVRETLRGDVGGLPLLTPMVDIVTLGAGGGSIAHVDAGGFLRVGPGSAEADPGPACYGRGGTAPTATDAHCVLGHVTSLLGGAFPLDATAARAAIAPVADRLGLTGEDAADAILEVQDGRMVAAARLAATRRGLDPRDFALAAFGGAGPLRAVAVARALGIRRVLVPPNPGVLSAWGLLATSLRRDGVRACLGLTIDDAAAALEDLGGEVAAALAKDVGGDVDVRVTYRCDARYAGQSHELTLPVATPADLRGIAAWFHDAHAAAFGHRHDDREVELVNVRARAEVPPGVDATPPRPERGDEEPPAAARAGARRARIHGDDLTVNVWARDRLLAANRIEGPCIIEETNSTTLLPAGARAHVDPWGVLVMEVSQ